MKPVRFAVPTEVAFDYLVDPVNRPLWQSSLSRVEDVRGEVGVGQTWVDVTVPGLRPQLETTELVRPRRWTERGTWRSVDATLTLTFEPVGQGAATSASRWRSAPVAWPGLSPRHSPGSRPAPYAAT